MQNFSLSTGQTENYSVSYEYNALGMPSALNFGGKVKNYSYIPGTGMLNQTTVKEGENTVMTGNYTYDQYKHTPQSCLPALTELGTFGGSLPPKAPGTLRRPRLSGASVRRALSAVLTPSSMELVDFFGLSAVVGGTTHTFGYTLNDKNQRVGATLPNGKNWTFEYDTLGQLSGAIFKFNELAERTLSYDYDQIGNRTQAVEDSTTTNYASNLLNQYTAIAATGTTPEAPTYDADGNMLTNGEWAYTWNGENRLIALESATARIEFDYDYMGRRYERRDYIKSGSEWVLNTTKHFVYSGFKLVAEYTNGMQENSYAWDVAGLDTPAFLKRDGSTYSYWSDGNKNILKLFSNTDAVAEYAYDPFGRVTSTNGALALLNPFRFSSEYHNDTTGLVEYIYREYSPLLGRWLTKDPIEEQGGLNLYGMVNNDSIGIIDLLGFDRYVKSKSIIFSNEQNAVKESKVREYWESYIAKDYKGCCFKVRLAIEYTKVEYNVGIVEITYLKGYENEVSLGLAALSGSMAVFAQKLPPHGALWVSTGAAVVALSGSVVSFLAEAREVGRADLGIQKYYGYKDFKGTEYYEIGKIVCPSWWDIDFSISRSGMIDISNMIGTYSDKLPSAKNLENFEPTPGDWNDWSDTPKKVTKQ